jgi:hypothetical protein
MPSAGAVDDDGVVISRERAVELAEAQMLRQRDRWPANAPTLAVGEVEEHELGWIVHWASVEYLRTGDSRYLLGGGGPYLVDRYDGSVHALPTVASLSDDWVWMYLEQVRGIEMLDVLAETVRQLVNDEGTLAAIRYLRRREPGLTPAQAKEYVAAVRDGRDLPPEVADLTRSPREYSPRDVQTLAGPA